MARTEIWLRLMYVGDLYGEAMLNMANSLIRQPQINRAHLQESGLTARQAERFYSFQQVCLKRRYAGLNYRSTIFCVQIVRFILPNCVLLTIIPALFLLTAIPPVFIPANLPS